jgi:excisionase family DNA binding protein
MEKRFLGVKELAQYIGIKTGTIYVWVCHRKIPYLKIGGSLKFDLHEIEKWLEEKRTAVYN